ncbi:MAG: hypothetical protein HND48_07415 [Chloroflexi bacterium]|nr:hypothetical protein [Chloroflexota bacterium]
MASTTSPEPTKSISPMGARRIVLAALAAVLLLAACAPARQPPPRVALLAPFEGRYREIGYDVLYALRLGLADSGSDVIVNAVDISREADLRASAVANDPAILAVIAAGPQLSDTAVLGALHGIPTIVLGDWDAPHDPAIFFMAPSQTSTIPAVVALDTYHWDDDDARGGDVFAFARVRAAQSERRSGGHHQRGAAGRGAFAAHPSKRAVRA